MSERERWLNAAATRLPGPWREPWEETGPSEVLEVVRGDPAAAAEVTSLLAAALSGGGLDVARLATYLADALPLPLDAPLAGYRRADLSAFERSKLAFPLGVALMADSGPLPPEIASWSAERGHGAAFWGARFLRGRAELERDAAHQLSRVPAEAAEQLWFAAARLDADAFETLLQSLEGLQASFGRPWFEALRDALRAVRA